MSFFLRPLSKIYINKMSDRLGKYGLTFHDVVAETGVFKDAIDRLTPEEREARQRRLLRASDLNVKHYVLPPHMRQDPFREYKRMRDLLAETQQLSDEKKALNNKWWMPYRLGRVNWFPYDTSKAWFFPFNKKN